MGILLSLSLLITEMEILVVARQGSSKVPITEALGQVHPSIVTFHPNDISSPPVFDIPRVLQISLTSAPGPGRTKTAAPGGPVPRNSGRRLALGKDS